MKVVITNRQDITSRKSGDKWTVFRGIAESGKTVEAWLSEKQALELDIPEGALVSKSQLKQLFEELPVVDVEYDQDGRVETIKA